MTAAALILFLLALFGIAETMYLIRNRAAKQAPACPIGDPAHCKAVLDSKYNDVFGIHNDSLGLLFHVCVALVTAYAFVMGDLPGWVLLGLQAAIAGSALFSVYLIYIQWQVIKQWCFWCILSACTAWAMAVVAFGFLG